MPFNSVTFLVFFILFTGVFYLFKNSNSKTLLLIAGSWFFYSYLNIFNLFHLLITTAITFFFAIKIKGGTNSKAYLAIGIFFIVTQLLLTKYSAVITNLFSEVTQPENQFFNYLILPIGISFYSLQAIGLLVDIQNRKYDGELSFKNISLFLSLFPQSISGPIHRAKELLPQFNYPNRFQVNNIVVGFKTMLWGYFCKLMVADKISILTTPIFHSYYEKDGLSLSIASLLYSLQIYFDFWGYSLIAIGAGRILGFTININFNSPYLAASFREFWHRWHITLSKWLRDYIYIPLGGRKQENYFFFCCSIFITFLVSGFWHGITINFILWGAIHAILYLLEDFIRQRRRTNSGLSQPVIAAKLIRLLRIILFFILISFTWLIFRTTSISELLVMLEKIMMISDWSTINAYNNYLTFTNVIYSFIILFVLFFSRTTFLIRKTEMIPKTTTEKITDSVFVCACTVFIILWGDIGGQEFLYFRF